MLSPIQRRAKVGHTNVMDPLEAVWVLGSSVMETASVPTMTTNIAAATVSTYVMKLNIDMLYNVL